MERINVLRVVAGGLVAGAFINLCEYVVNGVLLKRSWAIAMRNLSRSAAYDGTAMASFLMWGFLVGVFAVWLYAAIRPRYGAGPKTAVVASIAVWLLGSLLNSIPGAAMHLFPRRLVIYGVVLGLVEALGGTLLGAWLYKEPVSPAPAPQT